MTQAAALLGNYSASPAREGCHADPGLRHANRGYILWVPELILVAVDSENPAPGWLEWKEILG